MSFILNGPKGRVPRPWPWVNESSPEGRQAKLVFDKCHGLARGYLQLILGKDIEFCQKVYFLFSPPSHIGLYSQRFTAPYVTHEPPFRGEGTLTELTEDTFPIF